MPDFPSDRDHQISTAPRELPEGPRRLVAASAYLVFFVPILISRSDALLRYHVRQGAGLFLLWILAAGLAQVCNRAGLRSLSFIGYAVCVVLMLVGIYKALGLQKEPLPYLGRFFERLPLWSHD